MRTTLTLDDDVLAAVRQIADETGRTMGETASMLIRRSLNSASEEPAVRNDYRILTVQSDDHTGPLITLELVNRLRDEGI